MLQEPEAEGFCVPASGVEGGGSPSSLLGPESHGLVRWPQPLKRTKTHTLTLQQKVSHSLRHFSRTLPCTHLLRPLAQNLASPQEYQGHNCLHLSPGQRTSPHKALHMLSSHFPEEGTKAERAMSSNQILQAPKWGLRSEAW